MKPMIDPERDLEGATPETLARALLRPVRRLAARGASRRCIRPALRQGHRRCSSVTYYRYAPSSRLVLARVGIATPGSRRDARLSPRAASLERGARQSRTRCPR